MAPGCAAKPEHHVAPQTTGRTARCGNSYNSCLSKMGRTRWTAERRRAVGSPHNWPRPGNRVSFYGRQMPGGVRSAPNMTRGKLTNRQPTFAELSREWRTTLAQMAKRTNDTSDTPLVEQSGLQSDGEESKVRGTVN